MQASLAIWLRRVGGMGYGRGETGLVRVWLLVLVFGVAVGRFEGADCGGRCGGLWVALC